jgi:hypothetical protein
MVGCLPGQRYGPLRRAEDTEGRRPVRVSDPRGVTFFYGSCINPAVLGEVGQVPDRVRLESLLTPAAA